MEGKEGGKVRRRDRHERGRVRWRNRKEGG